MAREIKQKIVLDGEKEYGKAIKDAQRNLRTLRSELKAETAELGTNATAQEKNQKKADSLKKQIAEQEKIVKTLKAALEEAKEQYGDNEDVVQKWEQKLNDARTTLANLNNDLSKTGTDMDSLGDAMKSAGDSAAAGVTATRSFAESLQSIGNVGDGIASAIEGAFSEMIGFVTDAISDLWELISDTAARADEWGDIAGYWNTDATTVEAYSRALDSRKKSFEDLNSIVSKLVLGGKEKEIAEMIGVSAEGYTDKWEYAMACLDALSKRAQSGENLEDVYEGIFGEKRAQKVMNIVNDWEEIQKAAHGTFDAENGGYGLDSGALDMLQDVYMLEGSIEAKWKSIQDKFAEKLAPVTLDLMMNVDAGLDALKEYMDAETPEEQKAALDKLTANIKEMCEKAAKAIEAGLAALSDVGKGLQESDDPLVSAVGKLLSDLTDSLQWMIDNQDAVKGAIEAIFGAWLVAKLAGVAGKLTSIVADIKTVKAFKDWNVASGAGSGAASAAGSGAAKAAGGAAGTAGLGTAIKGAAAALGQLALPIASFVGTGILWHTAMFDDSEEKRERMAAIEDEVHEALVREGFISERPQDQYTDQMRADAADKWWDAVLNGRNTELETELLQDVFGTDFGSKLVDDINTELAFGQPVTLQDMPSDWWQSVIGGADGKSMEQLTAATNNLSAAADSMEGAAERGISKGMSGVVVQMDGSAVGRIVLPYVQSAMAFAYNQ